MKLLTQDCHATCAGGTWTIQFTIPQSKYDRVRDAVRELGNDWGLAIQTDYTGREPISSFFMDKPSEYSAWLSVDKHHVTCWYAALADLDALRAQVQELVPDAVLDIDLENLEHIRPDSVLKIVDGHPVFYPAPNLVKIPWRMS